MTEWDYYTSQLMKLGDCQWPDVNIIIKGPNGNTKHLTLDIELAEKILAWTKKTKLECTPI